MDIDFRFEPATAGRRGDFEMLFGPRGAFYDCWCVAMHLPHALRAKMPPEERKAHIHERITAGPPPGILAYAGKRACRLGPGRTARGRAAVQFTAHRLAPARRRRCAGSFHLGRQLFRSGTRASRQGIEPSIAGRCQRPCTALRRAPDRCLSDRSCEAVEIGDALHRIDGDLRCRRFRNRRKAERRKTARAAGFAVLNAVIAGYAHRSAGLRGSNRSPGQCPRQRMVQNGGPESSASDGSEGNLPHDL